MKVKKGDTVRFIQEGKWKTGIVVGIDHNNGLINVRLHNYGQSCGATIPEEDAEVLEIVDLTLDELKAFARFEITYLDLVHGIPYAPITYDKSYTLTLDDVFAALKNRKARNVSNDDFGLQWFLPMANEIDLSGAIEVFDWTAPHTDPVAADIWEKLLTHYDELSDYPKEYDVIENDK